MASPPQVQHAFDGDVKVLNATFDRRMEIRKILQTLQQDLLRFETQPTSVKAEIKFMIGGTEPRQHCYTVTIADQAFDADEFARAVPPPSEKTPIVTSTASVPLSSPQLPTRPVNGQPATPAQSTPQPQSSKADGDGDDDVVEIRPFKRLRSSVKGANEMPSKETDSLAIEPSKQTSGRVDELFDFIREWHAEWVRQGGWLFDNISKANTGSASNKSQLEKKMDSMQDVLGQSLNSASASSMSELTNISKLIPWLEHCRKTSADKVQAREEKWRTSSATFHDQTRREREAAEKRIEKKLEDQKNLLSKVARASGIDIDETEAAEGGSPDRSREASLGAQLTRELNMEAAKSGNASKDNAEPETINIEDDS